MATPPAEQSPELAAWRTNCRVTAYLVESLPPDLWGAAVPGVPRKTILTYFVAHEAHHRGQVVLIARQLGQRLPPAVVDGLWQWTSRRRESS